MAPGVLMVVIGFVSGAVPYGLLISRARGIDLRQIGSGNIGATNAARALGKRLGALVLLLDTLKGLLPTVAARLVLGSRPDGDLWIAGTMAAAVLGHMFTPLLRFRGGKGVATGLGVIAAACPWAGLLGLAIYAGIYAAFRISSVGSLVGTLLAAPLMYLFGTPVPQCLAALFVGLLIVVKHHENLRRLVKGEEKKI